MKITEKKRKYQICDKEFEIKRSPEGVPKFWVKTVPEFCQVMGFLHAHDRMIQMMLVKVISQGRICELLKSTPENLEVDIFIRELGFAEQAKKEITTLDKHTLGLMQNYCNGVNDYIERYGFPFEFRLAGFRPDEWRPEDTLSSVKIMSYSGLAQTQQDVEKLIAQAIHQGVDLDKLKSLFQPHLNELNTELVDLIKKVRMAKPLVPKSYRFLSALPKIMASNNWVVGKEKTRSGEIIQCNDPHLECNRLPGVWYEFIAHINEGFCMGVNIPGVPGLNMGRTENFGLSFTYGFMDMVDFFIEEIKDGKYREGDEFVPLVEKKHKIKKKKSSPFEFSTFHTPRGPVERDLAEPLKDGYYLSRSWAGDFSNTEKSLQSNFKILTAKSAKEIQQLVQNVSTSCNWIIGDKNGKIIYQQSGAFPKRSHSGLFPVPGWIKENPWDGLHGTEQLASLEDPEEGFFCTANNDLNQPGKPLSINMPMGSYRVERIRQLLSTQDKLDKEQMKVIQKDLYSLQAERYLPMILPLLPDEPQSEILRNWDKRYDRESQGATLFEEIYNEIIGTVFGRDFFSQEVWDYLKSETAMIVDFYAVFDRILLEPENTVALWFRQKSREEYFKEAISSVFKRMGQGSIVPWGKTREVMMTNIFFQGALPKFLGFDKGPFPIEGGRATICQGAVYRAHGRQTTFCPSYRFISDFSEASALTVVAGGPSDRRWSRYYSSDVDNWHNFKYKTLKPE